MMATKNIPASKFINRLVFALKGAPFKMTLSSFGRLIRVRHLQPLPFVIFTQPSCCTVQHDAMRREYLWSKEKISRTQEICTNNLFLFSLSRPVVVYVTVSKIIQDDPLWLLVTKDDMTCIKITQYEPSDSDGSRCYGQRAEWKSFLASLKWSNPVICQTLHIWFVSFSFCILQPPPSLPTVSCWSCEN